MFSQKNEEVPTKDNAREMMRVFIEDTELSSSMEAAFKVGAALYSIGCSYLVTQAYLGHPSTLAEKLCMARGQDGSFKATKKLSSFRDIILSGWKRTYEGQASSRSSRSIQNLISQLSSGDDDEPPRRKSPKASKTKRSRACLGNL